MRMTFVDGTFNSEVTLKITPINAENINNVSNLSLIGSAYDIDTNCVEPKKL